MSLDSATWYRLRREKRNAWHSLRHQSRLKLVVLTFATVIFEAGLFFMFRDGLQFMASLGAGGGVILQRLLALFFLGMTLLLALSALAASYGTLFRAGDIPMLIVSPSRPSRITLFKSIEVAELSASAYVFVVLPFAGAYAVHGQGSVWMLVWILVFSVPLVALTTAAGVLAALVLARWFPGRRLPRRLLLGGSILALLAVLVRIGMRNLPLVESGQLSLASFVPGMRLASHAAMPSFWLSEGVSSLLQGRWLRGAMFWLTLATTAAMLLLLVERAGGAWYHLAWTRVAAGAQWRGHPRLLEILPRLLRFLPHDARAMAVKDVRTFLRDPMQWSQSLVFFGLLTAYFATLQGFQYDRMGAGWRNFTAFMNAFSVATVTCSLASRFCYPQLSFEGQAFWLLGMAPTNARRIVIFKFVLSAVWLAAIAVVLMQLSARMLRVPASSRAAVTWLAVATAWSVSGLSTGLGTIFMDLRHRNPAAVVAGLGGTLNLVLGLGYIIAALAPFGVVFHRHALERLSPEGLKWLLGWLYLWLATLTLAATALPLWFGCRSLARRDC